jgi:hypothetical protein
MKDYLIEHAKRAKSHRDWKAIYSAYSAYKKFDSDIENIRPELDRLRKESKKWMK